MDPGYVLSCTIAFIYPCQCLSYKINSIFSNYKLFIEYISIMIYTAAKDVLLTSKIYKFKKLRYSLYLSGDKNISNVAELFI